MTQTHPPVRGFSLIELLVVVAVLAVLASLTVPGFRSLIESRRVQSAAFDLYSSLVLARSEAIKRNSSVTLNLQDYGNSQFGWSISSAGGEVIRAGEPVSGVIWGRTPSTLTGVTFTGTGRAAAVPSSSTTPSFQLDSSSTKTDNVRCVTISLSGLPQPKKGACP